MKRLLAFPYTEGLVYVASLTAMTGYQAECLAMEYVEAGFGAVAGDLLLFGALAALPALAVLLIRLQLFDLACCLYVFDIDCP